MYDINLREEFSSQGKSLGELFHRHEEGFIVPNYRHQYTWQEDEINQLFDDLTLGIRELSKDDGEGTSTFLGTVIVTDVPNRTETVRAGEGQALPSAIQAVVDGQQRISTVALLGIQLRDRLKTLKNSLPVSPPYEYLRSHADDLIGRLEKLYSVWVGRSSDPPCKPKIIHTRTKDRWTFRGDDSTYRSPVALYIAKYIRTDDVDIALSSIDRLNDSRVRDNTKLIADWLDRICNAHVQDEDLYEQFPVGKKITTERMHEYILGYPEVNEDLRSVIAKTEANRGHEDWVAAAIYHLFLLSYYLLSRCGINRLQPKHQELGYDMFQALNATGTPLTAIETFLPQVMQQERKEGEGWEQTQSCQSIGIIDKLFETTTNNQEKTRRSNELLRAFALSYEAKKLGNRFSAQRCWLKAAYITDLRSLNERRGFLHKLAQAADFFRVAWYMEEYRDSNRILGLEDHVEGKLCSFLVQYVRAANAGLVAPILARFYSQYMMENNANPEEFIKAVKACAAFFSLWRSAHSTAGLDEYYRRFFKGANAPVVVNNHGWKFHSEIQSSDLKKYFASVLEYNGIARMDSWVAKSEPFLLYTKLKTVCRFMLFLGGHNRCANANEPGLTKETGENVCELLELNVWKNRDYRSLEHVAPQKPSNFDDWDHAIYAENRVNSLGNLLLLPQDINKDVGNGSWKHKYFHYLYVGRPEQEEIARIREDAKKNDVGINSKVAKRLSECNFNCTVAPIVQLGIDGPWDASMIDSRTRQLKEIVWNRLASWLDI